MRHSEGSINQYQIKYKPGIFGREKVKCTADQLARTPLSCHCHYETRPIPFT